MHLVGHFGGLTGSQAGAFLYLQRQRRTVTVSAAAKDPMIAYKLLRILLADFYSFFVISKKNTHQNGKKYQ